MEIKHHDSNYKKRKWTLQKSKLKIRKSKLKSKLKRKSKSKRFNLKIKGGCLRKNQLYKDCKDKMKNYYLKAQLKILT